LLWAKTEVSCARGDGIPGDINILYQCTGGVVTVSQPCPNGCKVMPAGTNDQCQ
jgi:hypothetical protein